MAAAGPQKKVAWSTKHKGEELVSCGRRESPRHGLQGERPPGSQGHARASHSHALEQSCQTSAHKHTLTHKLPSLPVLTQPATVVPCVLIGRPPPVGRGLYLRLPDFDDPGGWHDDAGVGAHGARLLDLLQHEACHLVMELGEETAGVEVSGGPQRHCGYLCR